MTDSQKSKIEKIIQLATANDVEFNKKFPLLMNAGAYASQDCSVLADLAYEIVTDIFTLGFEKSKFDMQMNSDVKYITKLWASLVEPRAVLRSGEVLHEFNDIKQQYKSKMSQGEKNVRDIINTCIDDTIRGIDVTIGDAHNVISKAALKSGKAKLELIKSKIADICDVVSKDANEFAKEILGESRVSGGESSGIMGWREKIYSQLLTAHDEVALDKAIEVADKWKDTLRIPNRKKLVKSKEQLTYDNDSFDNIIKLPKVRAAAEQFFVLLDMKSKPDAELKARRLENENLQREILAIDNTLAEYSSKYASGQMSADEFVAIADGLENDKILKQQELDNNRMLFGQIEKQNALFNQLVKKYELLKHYYKFFERRSPHYFIEIFSGIDYNRFIDILNGVSITGDSYHTANTYIEAVLKAVELQTQQLAKETQGFDEILNAHKTANPTHNVVKNTQEERIATVNKADELLKKYGRPTQAVQQNAKEPTVDNQEKAADETDKLTNI